MSNLTTEIYEILIKHLVNENESLKLKLAKAEKLAKDRLEDAINKFDQSLPKPFPNKKDGHQWSMSKVKKIAEPRWHWYD